MPGKLKVKVVAGRNLPVMDRSSELTDAFVEVFADVACSYTITDDLVIYHNIIDVCSPNQTKILYNIKLPSDV